MDHGFLLIGLAFRLGVGKGWIWGWINFRRKMCTAFHWHND